MHELNQIPWIVLLWKSLSAQYWELKHGILHVLANLTGMLLLLVWVSEKGVTWGWMELTEPETAKLVHLLAVMLGLSPYLSSMQGTEKWNLQGKEGLVLGGLCFLFTALDCFNIRDAIPCSAKTLGPHKGIFWKTDGYTKKTVRGIQERCELWTVSWGSLSRTTAAHFSHELQNISKTFFQQLCHIGNP